MAQVIIIGAGLAGLSTALHLQDAGHDPLLFEREPVVGGRVATDRVDGFLLDRGFQVLLDSYPAARALFDLDALELSPFRAGARVRRDDGWVTIVDAVQEPAGVLATLRAAAFTAIDVWRTLHLRTELASVVDGEPGDEPRTTIAFLRERGFSERAIERFFRPFFSGVFLEPDLETPADFFRFVFRMFATGAATLPAGGMGAIPAQLASRLPPHSLRTGCGVREVGERNVTLESGETIAADAVVMATDLDTTASLLGLATAPAAWRGCTTIHFATSHPPFPEPILALNGTGHGTINSVVVPSNVAPTYAPAGQALVSATMLGVPAGSDADVAVTARTELRQWFEADVDRWRMLRVVRVPRALPVEFGAAAHPRLVAAAADRGVVLAGDYLVSPSINGALISGARAAAAVEARLPVTTPA